MGALEYFKGGRKGGCEREDERERQEERISKYFWPDNKSDANKLSKAKITKARRVHA
jgi:hypothetical protein